MHKKCSLDKNTPINIHTTDGYIFAFNIIPADNSGSYSDSTMCFFVLQTQSHIRSVGKIHSNSLALSLLTYQTTWICIYSLANLHHAQLINMFLE